MEVTKWTAAALVIAALSGGCCCGQPGSWWGGSTYAAPGAAGYPQTYPAPVYRAGRRPR